MTLRHWLISWLMLSGMVAEGHGQQWARRMFDHTSHDFGFVARGAKAEHTFTMENIYVEDARIATIRTTCGCTTTRISKTLLKTWEKAEITAVVDTRSFLGRKDATLTVVLDRPFPAEVQLNLYCYIRGDVVLQPGAVQFGTVPQGAAAQRKLSVSYAGRGDWQIVRVESVSPYLAGQVVETLRGGNRVAYDLIVTLRDDAPPGTIQEHLMLVTNDSGMSARVPVPVEGVVAPAVSVRPALLMMGVVETGGSVTRQLVIQGQTPFRITAVQCDDPRITVPLPEKADKLHIIPVTFRASDTPGNVSAKLRIVTDLAGTTHDVPIQVQIVPHS
jgi:hypothetical protein